MHVGQLSDYLLHLFLAIMFLCDLKRFIGPSFYHSFNNELFVLVPIQRLEVYVPKKFGLKLGEGVHGVMQGLNFSLSTKIVYVGGKINEVGRLIEKAALGGNRQGARGREQGGKGQGARGRERGAGSKGQGARG